MNNYISKGVFLISNPYVPDSNFYKTVVFICEYNESGAFGLILNRPLDVTTDQIIPDSVELIGSNRKIYIGGPVDTDKIFCLHGDYKDSRHDCERICENVYLGSTKECFKSSMSSADLDDSFCRIYLGCSCWSEGQLETELEMNLWTVGKANEKLVFYPNPDRIWWNVSHFANGPDITNPILN